MTSAAVRALRREMAALADPERAAGVARFFKTGPGEYGEGDRFLGLTLPQIRQLAREAKRLSVDEMIELLHSKWHEERTLALIALVRAHERGSDDEKRKIHRAYLANTDYVNNWDLVDVSAGKIVGYHVAKNDTRLLERLARSRSVWERRIAMIATFYGIRHDELGPALLIAERLLGDDHDLIHKAVGWMLREVGKRDGAVARRFLEKHAAHMPRTTLRYAIERFSVAERKRFMEMGRPSKKRPGTARSATARSATARSEKASPPRRRRSSASRR